MSDLDALTHDLGCQCWPHVSREAATNHAVEAARMEYRLSRHRQEDRPTAIRNGRGHLCRFCGIPWPCDAGVALALLVECREKHTEHCELRDLLSRLPEPSDD